MKTLSFWQWVELLALLAFAIFVVYHQYKILEFRQLRKVKLKELSKFERLVEDCDVDMGAKLFIEQKLKHLRAESVMEDAEFCNRVDAITTLYYQRFGLMGYSSETGV